MQSSVYCGTMSQNGLCLLIPLNRQIKYEQRVEREERRNSISKDRKQE
jgi:hypothetical protein